ncbi:MAG TPA: hydrogenase maturation protease [Vicinamibacteria bacterium]|nr:hydrogenase maturation protease [Vicinamibacteria bacterium]
MVDIEADAVLVIAWGNPLREDDGLAWHVLEGLRRLRPRPGLLPLHLRHAHQLTPELAEPVSRAAGVVFVDARRDGPVGAIRSETVEPASGSNPLAHSLSPQGVLLYAEALYGRAPQAVVVSITGERFGLGEELSPAVRRALPWAIRTVLRQAGRWSPAPEPVSPETDWS